MLRSRTLFLTGLLCASLGGLAQADLPIGGLTAVFADDLSQWDVLGYDGERVGELGLRYPPVAGRGGDFSQWSFRLEATDDSEALDGEIRPEIRGRRDRWAVRVGEHLVTVRPVYDGQYDEWAIGDGRTRTVFVVRDFDLLEYWSTRGPGGPGNYAVYTSFEGDPREWQVLDETTAPVDAATQLAMLWLPVYLRLTLD